MELTKEILTSAIMKVGISSFIVLYIVLVLTAEHNQYNNFKFIFSKKIMMPNLVRLIVGTIALFVFITFFCDKVFI